MSAALTHLVVLDFEATCDDETPPAPQEIIEFPSVLLRADTLETVDEFESFVRPVHCPSLTRFCTELTGITQADVDGARPFPEVLTTHLAWLASHGLPTEGNGSTEPTYVFVTCGDWDLQTMLPNQLAACVPPIVRVPPPYRRWVNVKLPFMRFSGTRGNGGMTGMLEQLGLTLDGRHHRGIDDCRNIAKIVRALAARRQEIAVITELPLTRHPPIELLLERAGECARVMLKARAISTLLGVASTAFRAGAKRVFLGEVQLTKDEALFDLESGATLRVE